ncbi:MAG: SDR family oxidoreductase [Acidobacteriota bacterium]
MKVLVLGGNGMLGHKLVQQLNSDFEVFATTRQPFAKLERFGIFESGRTFDNVDVENVAELERVISAVRPDVVINAVGIIKQLPSSKDVITTLSVNSILPHRLHELADRYSFRLVCVSTDCVFGGGKGMYSENDPADAYDLYGRSKNLGEVVAENCLTLRTSIIGRELTSEHSMVEWFLSNRGKTVNGYVNAIYSGFPTIEFTDIIANLLREHRDLHGLYHVSSEPINKFELLGMINQQFDSNIEIERFEDFAIDRSLDSSRFRAVTGFEPPTWQEMVRKMAADPTPYDAFRK